MTLKIDRGITILEPWAMLLAAGIKPVENRTWATNYRGPVAIHAGSNIRELDSDELERWLCSLHPDLDDLLTLPLIAGDDPSRPKISSIFHPGCIVGTMEIFDCLEFNLEAGDDFEQLCRARGHGAWFDSFKIPPYEFANGPFCFLARDFRQFTQPIPCKGALNIWNLKAPELAAVAAALRKPLGSPYHYRKRIAELAAARKPGKALAKPSK